MNVAHNDLAQILVELGYAGLTTWLLLLCACAYRALRNATSLGSIEHAGALSALCAIQVYSLEISAIPVPTDPLFLFAGPGIWSGA